MRTSRGMLVGLMALVLTGPLAACGDAGGTEPSTGATTAAAVPADPRQALTASTKGLAEGNHAFALAGHEQDGEGVFHKPSTSARYTLTFGGGSDFAMTMQMIHVAPESWTKLKVVAPGLPGAEKANSDKWQHIDPAKAKGKKDLEFDWADTDVLGVGDVLKGLVAAEKAGDGTYTGTVDVSGATGSGVIDEDMLQALGAKAKAVPFQATLDDQGRLTVLTLKMPAAGDEPAHDLRYSYTDYGAAKPVAKPAAAETEEASAEVYEMFE